MKFSIIIPVYNVAQYLRECLDSLLAQTYSDWEAICVDDGSTDESPCILDEYVKRYNVGREIFRVLHKKNEGVSVARNAALDMAKGEYVGFMDSDDVIDVRWLETAERLLRENEATMVRFRCSYWENGQKKCRQHAEGAKYVVVDKKDDLVKWGWETYMRGGWSWLQFSKRELIGDIRYPVGMRNREDNIFCTRISLKQTKIVQSEYAGYYYRYRPGSSYNKNHKFYDSYRYITEARNLYDENKLQFERLNWIREAGAITGKEVGYEVMFWLDELKGYLSKDESRQIMVILRQMILDKSFSVACISQIRNRILLRFSLVFNTFAPFAVLFFIRTTYRRIRYGKAY